jgi:hypothetical protein
MTNELLPVLAHRLWVHWSQHIAEEENISQERLERWESYWVPYDELPEDVKQTDRDLAYKYSASDGELYDR